MGTATSGERTAERYPSIEYSYAESVDFLGFTVDATPSYSEREAWLLNGWYSRNSDVIIGGDEGNWEEELAKWEPISRCFNCGSTEHTVGDCPDPVDRQLVNLSRQMFNFFQTRESWQRIHVFEESRKQRLAWIDTFVPGEIRGRLLLEALGGSQDGEWLRNMAIWGYPKGWVGSNDPRHQMRARVCRDAESEQPEETALLIYGDDGQPVPTFEPNHSGDSLKDHTDEGEGSQTEDTASRPESACAPDAQDSCTSSKLPYNHRWAVYPTSYFSTYMLPIYNQHALPPVHSSESVADPPAPLEVPPPPPTTPPPLPSSPASVPLAPPPCAPPPLPHPPKGLECLRTNEEVSDMEISDDE